MLVPYAAKDPMFLEVSSFLAINPMFSYRTSICDIPPLQGFQLFCMSSEVEFAQSKSFSIQVWFPLDYPNAIPLVRLFAPAGMGINGANPLTDAAGVVRHSFLRSYPRAAPTPLSNLVGQVHSAVHCSPVFTSLMPSSASFNPPPYQHLNSSQEAVLATRNDITRRIKDALNKKIAANISETKSSIANAAKISSELRIKEGILFEREREANSLLSSISRAIHDESEKGKSFQEARERISSLPAQPSAPIAQPDSSNLPYLRAMSECLAIDDVLFSLSRLAYSGKLAFQLYLKQVRSLSKAKFVLISQISQYHRQ